MKNALQAFVLTSFMSLPVFAAQGWSLNIGYHNPPGANVGANFMYEWTNVAFEVGIGNAYVKDETNNNNNNNQTSAALGGDVNLKYLFGRGGFRPYLQGGVMLGTAATVGDDSGASAGTGAGFVGIGGMFSGNSVYFYLGANAFSKRSSEFFLGLGFDI